MTLEQAIDRYTNNAEYERTHGNLQGYLEFKQLAEWLKDYKRLLEQQPCEDAISRQAAIDALDGKIEITGRTNAEAVKGYVRLVKDRLERLPSAQPGIIRCKDCEYGEQDEVGRWFCRSLGCQIGNEDGSGYCADAERRGEQDG